MSDEKTLIGLPQRIKDNPTEVLLECRNIIMGMTVPEKLKVPCAAVPGRRERLFDN